MELRHSARFVIAVVLLCMVTMLVASATQAAAAVTPDARLASVINGITSTVPGSSGDQLLTIEKDLTGVQPTVIDGVPYDFGATRFCRWQRGPGWYGENGISMADEYIKDYMVDAGLDSVMVQPWTGVDHTYIPNWGKGDRVDGNSVIGELTGTTRPDEIVLVCGHTDSVAWGPDPLTGVWWFCYAPGADDNLSGAATAMIAAKTLSQYSFARTIRFACFGGEEQGLFGSDEYADYCREHGENIVAVVNVEMTGYDRDGSGRMEIHTRQIGNGHPASSVGNGYGDKAIADVFVDVVNAYGVAITPVILDDNQNYSDHWSFWTKSYNGISVEETSLKTNPNYHTIHDDLAHMTWPYYAKITAATVATTAHLAEIQ
jgi:hypothetical protein